MSSLVSSRDFRVYCLAFMSVYRVVLKTNIGLEFRSYVSTRNGSLAFFRFVKGAKIRFFPTRQTNAPIGKVLQRLPQRGFGGSLAGIEFRGKNVINEGSVLIIIKGENSPRVWTRLEAIRDAQEEIAAIRGPR